MPISDLLTLPCTITRRTIPNPATVDADGNAVVAESTATTVCELQQQRRDEDSDRGEVGAETWLLILPAGTAIGLADSVTADGHNYEVTGKPWPSRNPRTGIAHHIEATVKRAGGAST